jgi:hypothetical protein
MPPPFEARVGPSPRSNPTRIEALAYSWIAEDPDVRHLVPLPWSMRRLIGNVGALWYLQMCPIGLTFH